MATLRREDGPSAVKAEERSQQEGEMQIEQSRADALYDRCAQAPQGTVFFQRDLANMAVASDLSELLVLLQELVDKHLFKLMSFDGDPCWKLRPRDEAAKYVSTLSSVRDYVLITLDYVDSLPTSACSTIT
jgi:DNA-directed RNA polymerase III subunit RPC6